MYYLTILSLIFIIWLINDTRKEIDKAFKMSSEEIQGWYKKEYQGWG
jgi:hypothetical protein